MQTLTFRFPAAAAPRRRVHLGTVASGDLEILLTPHDAAGDRDAAEVRVRTSVDGFEAVWRQVLERFFQRSPVRGAWELNDFGATPAVVTLRLRQAVELARADQDPR